MKINLFKQSLTCSLLSIFVLCGCSPLMMADYDTGKQARRDGNYPLAIQHLSPLAEFGLPEAQYELALALIKNESSTPEDLARAKDLLMPVAESGNPYANFELGRYFKDQNDSDNAVIYYKRAAELGYERANFELASMSEKKKDYKTAEDLYKKAFNGNYYRAAERIARLYEKGRGHDVDLKAALHWYQVAQDNGVPDLEEKISELSSASSK